MITFVMNFLSSSFQGQSSVCSFLNQGFQRNVMRFVYDFVDSYMLSTNVSAAAPNKWDGNGKSARLVGGHFNMSHRTAVMSCTLWLWQ